MVDIPQSRRTKCSAATATTWTATCPTSTTSAFQAAILSSTAPYTASTRSVLLHHTLLQQDQYYSAIHCFNRVSITAPYTASTRSVLLRHTLLQQAVLLLLNFSFLLLWHGSYHCAIPALHSGYDCVILLLYTRLQQGPTTNHLADVLHPADVGLIEHRTSFFNNSPSQ